VRTDAADLLKRRLKQAGLPAHYSPHSFLATGIAKFLESDGTLRPLIRVFHVNSLRKDEKGKFLWPGYGENMRILKWIVDRARGRARAKETFIGWMPHYEDLDRTGLDFPKEDFEQLQKVDRHARRSEIIGHEELFLDLHEGLPKEMLYERELLICRI